MRTIRCALGAAWLLTGAGCATITVKHEVPPIFATVDVNIHVQQELEQVFDYEQPRGAPQAAETVAPPAPVAQGDQP